MTGSAPPRWNPTVSVVVAAYNYANYLPEALDSVAAQKYPRELLEVIVIDDGSTDETRQVLAGYASRSELRIRAIRQQNSGQAAAVNRGVAESSGELVAFLDADDAWLAGKLEAQIRIMRERPDVGIVFGDALPVDAAGNLIQRPSMGAGIRIPERAAARVFFENVALHSTILVRRKLLVMVPPQIPITDWWVTLNATMHSELGRILDCVIRYRLHGSNRGAGRHVGDGSASTVRPHLRDIQFKLQAIRLLDLSGFTAEELAYIWSGVEDSAARALNVSGSCLIDLTQRLQSDAAEQQRLAANAQAAADAGDFHDAAVLALKALAWDPYAAGAKQSMLNAVREAADASAAPDPLADARGRVIVCDLADLLADRMMITAYADAFAGDHGTTLVIDAGGFAQDVAETRLEELLSACGLLEREDLDMVAVVGRQTRVQQQRLRSGAHARYVSFAGRCDGSNQPIPVFTPASIVHALETADPASSSRVTSSASRMQSSMSM